MKLAIIPARGGSKRIPRKNIKPFGGLPMIAWSIRAAQASACFDRIIVSTDDDEIADVAKAYGAEVPFVRPAALSDDHTGTIPVVAQAIAWHNTQADKVSEACCIYATAPFVQPSDIARGYEVLQNSGADYAFSVTSYAFPIQRAIRITPNQRVEMFQPEHFNTRSQDLVEAWHDAGQFYWGHAHAWLTQLPLFTEAAAPVPIPRFRVQDIDTHEDWERAEWLLKSMQLNKEEKHDIQN
jgi:N-acylneuraminate cytidylyltransferase